MALWLVRAGRHGEHEQRFHDDNRIYLTFNLQCDLSKAKNADGIFRILKEANPDDPDPRAWNFARQAAQFVFAMKAGDWVVVPLRGKPLIALAEITGDYRYDKDATERYWHSRIVKWLRWDIPRAAFEQDLLYSFGAFMTVCQITRNDAEKRVRTMGKAGFPALSSAAAAVAGDHDSPVGPPDLELLAKDEIAKILMRKFKGHDLTRLVDAILRAQSYTTFVSPPGPDKGVDILAAPGPLGFGQPRLCVQVKSQDTPVDLPTLNQLIGSMQNVQAEQGLLVSWGGFKTSVDREVAAQFFRVRLWDSDALIAQLLDHYDKLDEDLRAELPLKRIWTVATEEPEE